MTDKNVEAVRAAIQYQREFQAILEEVAANALNPDPLIVRAELFSLYSSEELASGINAADKAGLSAKEGVACFVLLSAAAHAEIQKRKGILHRLMTKFAPRAGTPEQRHVAMWNYAIGTLLGGYPDQTKAQQFADLYQRELSQA